MIFWRQDGKELYYMAADQGVMAVDVGTTPTFASGKPRRLFRAPDPISGSISGTSVSRDGQQFLFNVPPAPRGARFPSQVTVFDRQGELCPVGPSWFRRHADHAGALTRRRSRRTLSRQRHLGVRRRHRQPIASDAFSQLRSHAWKSASPLSGLQMAATSPS